jgi:uncharacterized protein HemX
MTALLAIVALSAAGYALYRVDLMRDRIDTVHEALAATGAAQAGLRSDFDGFLSRDADARRAIAEQFENLRALPQRVDDLADSVAELRGRADLPERAMARSEVRFLLGQAQQRLAYDRDVAAATAALEAADARLATLSDPAFAAVREAIASELAALQAVPQPDRAALTARLAAAEQRVGHLPLNGRVVGEAGANAGVELPQRGFARAWAIVRSAFANLITVRHADSVPTLLSQEAADLKRQRLEMLLFAARLAIPRGDASTYAASLAQARAALDQSFEATAPQVAALGAELDALGQVDIDPPRPDISGSLRTLNEIPAESGRTG